jgi:SRSO17 transposase
MISGGQGMDVDQIRQLEPKLSHFLDYFGVTFRRKDTRAHLGVYVRGQLSDLPEKSVEPIALDADVAPRTLQEFLAQHRWPEDDLRERLQKLVAAEHQGPHTIGVFDETSDPKKGDKTPGVQKQWCGRLGKTENCIVTVHLGFACGEFHCLLDGELYLPESWAADRDRCREAGIPDTMVYRPKWVIALELYDRAVQSGIRFDWLTFDEGYGSKPELLRELTARKQRYVAEVPRSFTGWLDPPRVVSRPYHKNRRGRGRKTPRLASGSQPARRVDEVLRDPKLRDQPWQRFRVKDGQKGPMVWECKRALLTVKGADGLPGETLHLFVARDVLSSEELKFFLSNAPPGTSIETLLLVAFSRWRVERCFEDQKSEIGLDQYEGRRYLGLKRHLILSCVSYLFLSRVRQEWAGEKSRANGLPAPDSRSRPGPSPGISVTPIRGEAAGQGSKKDHMGREAKCRGSEVPLQTHSAKASRSWHQAFQAETMSVGYDLGTGRE